MAKTTVPEDAGAGDELERWISLLRATLDSTADGILVLDREGRVVISNRTFAEMWNLPEERLEDSIESRMPLVLTQLTEPEGFLARIQELQATADATSFDVIELKDGRVLERYSQPQRVGDEIVGRVWSFRDVTERRRAEEHLRQAQRMETVGRLAGGIAHDFNNILTAIRGYSELLLARLPPDAPESKHAREIGTATTRATALTRQLLAFSRRQVHSPKLIDVNEVVTGTESMLRRLIGEDMELATRLDPELGSVRADPGQVEQVLVNLAVNARDAMPSGGRLVIETENVTLDADYAHDEVAVVPGAYVRLAVADTGEGMDAETAEQVFEPFFTTKEPGEGTGLGLATVYGIVKQSGGYVWVYTEPGQGTTVKVYLPRVDVPAERPDVLVEHAAGRGGDETILLVEDDDVVRRLVTETLALHGYDVLRAADGRQALELAETGERIDLVLTDVVMPDMNGRELSDRLAELHADVKVIFMSGYAESVIVHRGVLEPGRAFLQKPFALDDLVRVVRKALDS